MNEELIVHLRPKSSISENIRTIRTNLQFSSIKENMKVILITSSIPGEGKSFISSNLAAAFAQTKKKVLLIDCDIRRGKQHRILWSKDEKGLSDLLISNDDVNNYIVKTAIDNLYLITRGTIAPNPSELLNSNKMKNLIAELKNRFDYIILDGVPVTGLPDALVLSKIADKTVIIASAGYTPTDLLVNTKKSLLNVGADIAGVVVNKLKVPNSSYYSKYYE
ncbi:MAG: CpsD/CapB family tyrosine-protein kinase [Bacilli bacterium]|nr:CpsD/CapB family tyrosine-protein kinase [Bacilli bacterium]